MECGDDLVIARVDDVINRSCTKNIPAFFGFLNEHESSTVQLHAKKQHCRYQLYGGYEGAERVIFAALPDWATDIRFPITAITFEYRKEYSLNHRDFLGSLMALGITREKIGDIVVGEGRTVVFIHDDIAEFVVSQTTKIGRVGVKVTASEPYDIEVENKYENITKTVASARLDCIVAAITNSSRNAATELILSGNVFTNGTENKSVSYTVKEGETLSVRKHGKYIIDSVTDMTKKGRLRLLCRRKI